MQRASLPPWPLWAVPVAVGFALVLAVFGFAVVRIVLAILGIEARSGDAALAMPLVVAQDLGLLAGAVLTAALFRRPTLGDFGLRPMPLKPLVTAALGGMLIFYGFAALLSTIISLEQEDDLSEQLGAGDGRMALVAFGLLVVIVAPVVEEVFFRGLVFTTIRRNVGAVIATLLTGALFGLVHASSQSWEAVVALSVFGALLCEVYRRTGSLLPCIAMHGINNAIAFAFATDSSDALTPFIAVGGLLLLGALVARVAYRSPLASETSPESSASIPPPA